jgi:hypothetical protein
MTALSCQMPSTAELSWSVSRPPGRRSAGRRPVGGPPAPRGRCWRRLPGRRWRTAAPPSPLGPSRRRPDIQPIAPLGSCRLWSGCRAAPRTARMGPRITPSQSAHSPQSPQKVRNSASIGRRRSTTPNHEAAGQAQVSSIIAPSRTSWVSSGSTSPTTPTGIREAVLAAAGREPVQPGEFRR